MSTDKIEFPALSVDPKVGISRSALGTDVWVFFLHMALKLILKISFVISFVYYILHSIMTFSERHSVFFVVVQK